MGDRRLICRCAVELSKGTTETSSALVALAQAQHEAAKPTAGAITSLTEFIQGLLSCLPGRMGLLGPKVLRLRLQPVSLAGFDANCVPAGASKLQQLRLESQALMSLEAAARASPTDPSVLYRLALAKVCTEGLQPLMPVRRLLCCNGLLAHLGIECRHVLCAFVILAEKWLSKPPKALYILSG